MVLWLLFNFVFLVLAATGIHQFRKYLISRDISFKEKHLFDGTFYQVGETDIIVHEAHDANAVTVICFPGFLENQQYFTQLYQGLDITFIALNNADYHSGYYSHNPIIPEWGKQNPYPVGTIEHDAYLLCEVIENIAGNQKILLHGHSRGGAGILEAGHQKPELTAGATALLEAPVLPKATASPILERFAQIGGLYFFPIYMEFLRVIPAKYWLSEITNYPLTPRKREIISASFKLPKHGSTAIKNMVNIREWQLNTDYDVYDHFTEIRVVIAERDSVLNRSAMLRSASKGEKVKIIHTEGTNHFISVEQPDTILKASGLIPPVDTRA